MTAAELRDKINKEIEKNGIDQKPPETLEVDHETYANVVWDVVNYIMGDDRDDKRIHFPIVSFGIHGGIFFKDIELILKREKE